MSDPALKVALALLVSASSLRVEDEIPKLDIGKDAKEISGEISGEIGEEILEEVFEESAKETGLNERLRLLDKLMLPSADKLILPPALNDPSLELMSPKLVRIKSPPADIVDPNRAVALAKADEFDR